MNAFEALRVVQDDLDRRSAWMLPAAEKIRRWREEDRRNGITWSDER